MCSRTLKIVLLGDGGTGKTSYISRVSSDTYSKDYSATLGYEITHAKVSTSRGDIKLALWDTAGQEKVGPLRDQYYKDAHGALLFFDVTSRITYKNIPSWHRDLMRVCEQSMPIVLFANKIDVSGRKVKTKAIHYHDKHDTVVLMEGSVKDCTNLKESLEYLLRRIMDDDSLELLPDDTLVQAMQSVSIGSWQPETVCNFSREEILDDWNSLIS